MAFELDKITPRPDQLRRSILDYVPRLGERILTATLSELKEIQAQEKKEYDEGVAARGKAEREGSPYQSVAWLFSRLLNWQTVISIREAAEKHNISLSMPRVYNKAYGKIPADAVYIGRPSPFGNPFTHLADKSKTLAQFHVANRDEAVDKYEEWLLTQPELVAKVKAELKGKDVICWCAPKRCHGDVLIRIANED